MLTSDELSLLESLVLRARVAAGLELTLEQQSIAPGDVVQLRPGADAAWETSLLWVTKIRENGQVSGIIMRPHRSGMQEAWSTFSNPEVRKIGRIPYPAPGRGICRQTYEPPTLEPLKFT
jgi:hypothetical protein